MLSAKLRDEITSALRDPQYQGFGGIPEPEDPLQWAIGHQIERYQEILLDPDVSACLQKRTHSVTSREWQVDAASDREIDQKAARFVRWMLSKKILFDSICLNLLEALVLGFKVGEILWESGKWTDEETGTTHSVIYAKDVRIRPSDRFTFYLPEKPNAKNASIWGYELRFLTTKTPVYGEALPDKKFIIHSIGSKTSNPFGVGLGSKLYWPHQFKKQAVISALVFGDKFAQPTIIGKHLPEQNPRKLEEFLRRITEGTSGVLPDGMDVSLLEASRSSSQNFYGWLIGWCEDQIKKVILSETFGDAPQGLSGQPAANDEKVRIELTKLDGDLLHATINETLIKWAVEFSFAGAEPPTVWRVFTTEEDLNSRANRDRILQDMGFRLTFAKFEEIYGEGYEDTNEEDEGIDSEIASIMGESPLGSPGPEEVVEEDEEIQEILAETPENDPSEDEPIEASEGIDFGAIASLESDPLSGLVDRTANVATSQVKDWLKDVRSLVETVRGSDSPDPQKFTEFKQGLVEIQKQADKNKLAEAIAKASLTADMGGRYEVMEEIDGDI
jgi:hypothetical protein